MSNVNNFSNLYLDLSQSAYEDRPHSFYQILIDTLKNNNDTGEVNYSKDYKINRETIFGGKNLPNEGVVYVHEDKTVQTVTEFTSLGNEYEYKKGLLSNEQDGFNSYFLTDTPG